ncbi:MAG: sensor histidine kinase N-terminal domain-containing protein [Rhodospirillales bacterium]|nr:sensor histidine kinase N-terminal domain-containing protein [Rhodospirillales bacterium]
MKHAPSLRRTFFTWISAVLAIAGCITAAATYSYSKHETALFLDGQLRQIALNAGPKLTAATAPAARDQDPEDRFAITIRDAAGHILDQSLPGANIPLLPEPGFATVHVGHKVWRVYMLRDTGKSVQVAQRMRVREEIASSAALGTALPVLLLIPLIWLVGGLALHRTLRRMDSLTHDLATRGARATAPLPLTNVPAELTPLVESMNGLILRLNAALAAQKRFLADAAHSLRTPIAAMQLETGNLMADTPTPSQRPRLEALAAAARRAAGLVGQLLRLARLDEPEVPCPVALDAAALLLACVADQAALADRNNIDLGATVAPPAMVRGVEDEMQTLFANLIENALIYTPVGGQVDVSLRRVPAGFSVEVQDNGPGLPAGTEAEIFERFFRAAPQAAEGSGLGLAIARRIAMRHGFGLEVRNRQDGVHGVLARVTMPGLND